MIQPTFPLFRPPVRFEERIKDRFLSVAHGGGVNSSAMLFEMLEREIIPDFIAMADTGGERPETYAIVAAVSAYLAARGFPEIQVVRWQSKKHGDATLEEECLRLGALPSKAYGWGKCSEKWKTRPQTAAILRDPRAKALLRLRMQRIREARRLGISHRPDFIASVEKLKLVKCIGFDAGEERRVKYPADNRFEFEYPLVEWGIFREDCEAICARHGFRIPKSSCFFCPSMRKPEILQLRQDHPELLARALAMEAKAKPNLLTVNGLGRRLNWSDFLAGQRTGDETPEQDCGCYDG
jgi:hypothetical protein